MIRTVMIGGLFLTSKVRLHCDENKITAIDRHLTLFLTSKVRLHCDSVSPLDVAGLLQQPLFLTSKVRLHCDRDTLGADRDTLLLFS